MKIQVHKGPLKVWAVLYGAVGYIMFLVALTAHTGPSKHRHHTFSGTAQLAITAAWILPYLIGALCCLEPRQYLPFTVHRARKIADPKLLELVDRYERGEM